MHVVIVGAGIIGTLTAYYLGQSGLQVTVIEEQDEIAHATSGANASQLSFSSIYSMASPTERDIVAFLRHRAAQSFTEFHSIADRVIRNQHAADKLACYFREHFVVLYTFFLALAEEQPFFFQPQPCECVIGAVHLGLVPIKAQAPCCAVAILQLMARPYLVIELLAFACDLPEQARVMLVF